MKVKTFNLITGVLILILILILNITFFKGFTRNVFSYSSRVIIVDAGHGGMDGGAIGKNGTIEKGINLEIANKLKAYIEQHGDTCIMVREVDEGLYSQSGSVRQKKNEDLKNRRQIIKENNADMFVSIHLNSFPMAKYSGAQVFYNKSDEESGRLAKLIQEELVSVLDKNNKRVEKAADTYYVLKENKIPSILVECGFLSNPQEERLLNDAKYQNKIAWAIYRGIMRYFTEPKIDK